MSRSRVHAVLTDVHFWIPVVVLALGATLLVLLGRADMTKTRRIRKHGGLRHKAGRRHRDRCTGWA